MLCYDSQSDGKTLYRHFVSLYITQSDGKTLYRHLLNFTSTNFTEKVFNRIEVKEIILQFFHRCFLMSYQECLFKGYTYYIYIDFFLKRNWNQPNCNEFFKFHDFFSASQDLWFIAWAYIQNLHKNCIPDKTLKNTYEKIRE